MKEWFHFCNKIQIQENIECCKEHIKLVENLNSKTKVCTKDIIKIVRKHVWKTFTYFNRAFCKPKNTPDFLKDIPKSLYFFLDTYCCLYLKGKTLAES